MLIVETIRKIRFDFHHRQERDHHEPAGGGNGGMVLTAPIHNVELASSPAFDDSGTVEYLGGNPFIDRDPQCFKSNN